MHRGGYLHPTKAYPDFSSRVQTTNLNLKLMCSDMGTDQITVCRNLQTTCELRHYDRGTLTAGFSSSLLFLCSSHLITRSPIASFLISIVSHSVNHSIISLFIHLCTDVLHQHEGHHPQTVGLGLWPFPSWLSIKSSYLTFMSCSNWTSWAAPVLQQSLHLNIQHITSMLLF